jgi:hypothetical protein
MQLIASSNFALTAPTLAVASGVFQEILAE